MSSKPIMVRKIAQKDNHAFTIEWSDGLNSNYRLSELQKHCQCANCIDEATGKRLINDKLIKDDLRAKRIVSVGRYALRIEFTSGCSSGIYDFDLLRKLGGDLS